ncbi:hypothetical protein ACFFRR_008648 [Megaselia abdita]
MSSEKGPRFGIRHLQTVLLFLAVFYANFTERNVPIALVAMTGEDTSSNPNVHTFNWEPKQKQLVLSSFFWGFVVSLIPGGFLAKKFGSKFMLFITIFGSAVLSLVTPIVVMKGEWKAFCGIRVAQGLLQGMVNPIVMEHVTKWSPQSEMTLHTSLSLSGVDLGTIAAMGLGGIIGGSSLGWPMMSYTSGVIGFFWCILWVIFGGSSPKDATLISPLERNFILCNQNIDYDQNKKTIIPWKGIFTSVAFYALLITTSAEIWGYSTMLYETPIYFDAVLNFDIANNALFSALPHIASWVMIYVYLLIGYTLVKREILSLGAMRKIFNSYGMFIPAAILIGLGFVDENHKVTGVVLVTLLNGVNVAIGLGSGINLIDIAPNYASVFMGIILVVNSIIGFITPLVVAAIVGDDESDRTRWQIVFAISAVIFVLGNLVFIFFAKFDVQPWNFVGDHDPKANVIDRQISAISRRESAVPRRESLDPWSENLDSRRPSNFSRRESRIPKDGFDPWMLSPVVRDERFDPRGNVFGQSRRQSLSSRRPSVNSI